MADLCKPNQPLCFLISDKRKPQDSRPVLEDSGNRYLTCFVYLVNCTLEDSIETKRLWSVSNIKEVLKAKQDYVKLYYKKKLLGK